MLETSDNARTLSTWDKRALLRRTPAGDVHALSSDGSTIYIVSPEREPARANPSCTCPGGIAGHQCYHWRAARERYCPDLPVPQRPPVGPRHAQAAAVAEAEAHISAAQQPTPAPDYAPPTPEAAQPRTSARPARRPRLSAPRVRLSRGSAQAIRAQALHAAVTFGAMHPEIDLYALAEEYAAYIRTGRIPA